MPPLKGLLPLAMLLATFVSGCAGPGAGSPPEGSVTVVTDPSQGRQDPTMGEHLHDYWGPAQRKVVLDETLAVGTMTAGAVVVPYSAAVARPAPGDVVPQGAASVEVTLTWTPSDGLGAANQYGAARLAVRTAADRDPQDLGAVASGQMVAFPSTNERNDLPHQVLSAWEFHWVLEPTTVSGVGGFVSFQGELHVRAEAVRGLDIPLYPGHPDQWHGRAEIPLFSAEGATGAEGGPDGFACFFGCPPRLTPDDGVVVPIDASHILVTLERDAPLPTRLGLAYHSAISRDWVFPTPAEETPTSRTYRIEVADGGDGAYASQSNWEFQLVIDEPMDHGAAVDTYRVAATVYAR